MKTNILYSFTIVCLLGAKAVKIDQIIRTPISNSTTTTSSLISAPTTAQTSSILVAPSTTTTSSLITAPSAT